MGPIAAGERGRGREGGRGGSKAKPTAGGAIYVPHNTKIRCVNSRQRWRGHPNRDCRPRLQLFAVKLRAHRFVTRRHYTTTNWCYKLVFQLYGGFNSMLVNLNLNWQSTKQWGNEAKSVAWNHWLRLSPSVALLRGQVWSSLGIRCQQLQLVD